MDLVRLRDLLAPLVIGLKDAGTHAILPSICQELGLPQPDVGESKRERLAASFDALADADLPAVAERVLTRYPPDAVRRNKIQDILWSDITVSAIPKRYRREVAKAIESIELFIDARRFDELIDKLWILDTAPWAALLGTSAGLRNEIQQHVHRNPEDWTAEILFDRLGAYESTDRRFALFLEGLASSNVRPDEDAQRRFVACVNVPLQCCGVELREIDFEGGYPVFTIVSLHAGVRGRPKNLIFASPEKPDLRFRDALDNDIEIVTNVEQVLVYDRPIGIDGLRWCDLQLWWSETEGIQDAVASLQSLFAVEHDLSHPCAGVIGIKCSENWNVIRGKFELF